VAADEPQAQAQAQAPVNPAPEGSETLVFIVREIVALLFVAVWVGLLVWDFLEGETNRVPFWFSIIGTGVLAYALGLNVSQLTSFRKPSPKDVVKVVRQQG
jgi:hypothetical protein